jgi:hypothetical protein
VIDSTKVYFKLSAKKYSASIAENMDVCEEPKGIRRYNMDDISV